MTGTSSEALQRAAAVARAGADDVDRRGVFPAAACDQLRAGRLLVPDWPVHVAAQAVAHLAGACASTGLIWAMHLALLEVLRRHGSPASPVARFLGTASGTQPLLAGATSEVGVGGDIRRSVAALTERAGLLHLEKAVPFASYADHADAVLVTARRSDAAAPSDQVLVFATAGQWSLQPAGPWEALGMRGTSSGPATLTVAVPPDHVLDAPFGEICAASMVPVSHTLWAACWTGIATDAVATARRFLRSSTSSSESGLDATRRLRLAEAQERLTALRALVADAARAAECHEAAAGPRGAARTTAFFNDVKVASGDLAVDVVMRCFEMIGASAYLDARQSPFSLSRQLRDVLSSKVMVSSDRIRTANGVLDLAAGTEGPPDLPDSPSTSI